MSDWKVQQHPYNLTPRDAGFDLRQVLNHRRYMRSHVNDYDEPTPLPSSEGSDDYIEDMIKNTMEMMKDLYTGDCHKEADGTLKVEEPATPVVDGDTVEMEVLEEPATPTVDGETGVQHSVITASYLKNLKCARPLHASTLASFDN